MMKIRYLLFLAFVAIIIKNIYAFSCQNMGRAGCISSCMAQNCATGYCDASDICRCSRCGMGAPWPSN